MNNTEYENILDIIKYYFQKISPTENSNSSSRRLSTSSIDMRENIKSF
jgi:hypothetical protein